MDTGGQWAEVGCLGNGRVEDLSYRRRAALRSSIFLLSEFGVSCETEQRRTVQINKSEMKHIRSEKE